jgi:hypothetical protein
MRIGSDEHFRVEDRLTTKGCSACGERGQGTAFSLGTFSPQGDQFAEADSHAMFEGAGLLAQQMSELGGHAVAVIGI